MHVYTNKYTYIHTYIYILNDRTCEESAPATPNWSIEMTSALDTCDGRGR